MEIPDPEKTKSYFELISSAWNALVAQTKKYDLFWQIRTQYRQRLQEKVKDQFVYGKNKPVPVKDFFILVKILDNVCRDEQRDMDAVAIRMKQLNSKNEFSHEPQDGLEVIEKYGKVFVLGKPGAGKSTFLQYIAYAVINRQMNISNLPIRISLKDWLNQNISLLDYLIHHFENFNLKNMGAYITRQLEKGNCLLLFDGLDETTDQIDEAIRQIKSFIERFGSNRYVISCRFASTAIRLKDFTYVEVADLNPEQQEQFVHNWFAGQEDQTTGDECWRQLAARPEIQDLASTPLLLCMLCLAFNPKTQRFPEKRSDLYSESLHILLEKWDKENDVPRHLIYKELSIPDKLQLLKLAAKDIFQERSHAIRQSGKTDDSPLLVTSGKLKDYITAAYRSVKQTQDNVDSEAIIRAVEAQHGLLFEHASGVFSFTLASIQEYLVAEWYVEEAKNAEKRENTLQFLIDSYLQENHWREVFVLVTEKLDAADDFLGMMRERIRQLATGVQKQCMNELDAAITSQLPQSRFFNRLLALYAITREDEFEPLIAEIMRIHHKLQLIPHVQVDFARFPQNKNFPALADSGYLLATRLLFDCLQTKCAIKANIQQELLDGLLIESNENNQKAQTIEYPAIILNGVDAKTEYEIITVNLPNLPKNAVPLQMIKLPAGSFMMGSPPDEKDRLDRENSQHEVHIQNKFYMGRFPVTQAQWLAVMGENPSYFKDNPNHPVESVSWNDSQAFIEKLNELTGKSFRLPSEAEWEYACRAETNTRCYWGDDPDYLQIWNHAWFYKNSFGSTQPVGLKNPNRYGLYDMSGNVWEWCGDDWHENYKGAPNDGSAWVDSPRGSSRVDRGGSWHALARGCRSANHDRTDPDGGLGNLGFRIVLSRTQ